MRKARWVHLIEDNPDFGRWYDNIARGGVVTAKENARILYRFLQLHSMSPRDLVDLAKKDRRKVEDVLMAFVAKLHKEGKGPNYIDNYLKAVKSWLNYNEVRLIRRIEIGNRNATPTLADERVPTRDELRSILSIPRARARCSTSLMAFSGLRPETIGNMRGRDGLAVKDLPEMEIRDKQVNFAKVPMMVVARPPLSKARNRYFTFLTREGCEYLKAYLEMRLGSGEELAEDSSIIAITPEYEKTVYRDNPTSFIATKNVTREIREAMRPRFKWRPDVLRAYFDTQLLLAENHGKISHAYRQFLVGHKGDIEARYTTNKGRLPEDVIEDMRQSFQKCEEYLSTTPKTTVDLEKIKIESVLAVAQAQGLRKERIDSIRKTLNESDNPTLDEAIQLLSGSASLSSSFTIRKPEDETKEPTPQPRSNDKPFQSKIIGEKELVPYTEEGWEIVRELRNRRYLVKKPNHVTMS